MIFWGAGLGVTGLFTFFFVSRQRQYGQVGAAVAGTGFFVAAFYLDSIFSLIMETMGDLYQGRILGGMGEMVLGIFVSKSILAAGLLAAETVRREPEREGWSYPHGLALGGNLLFGGLALACLYPGGLAAGTGGPGAREEARFAGALWLTFLLGVLLLHNALYFLYRKKLRAERIKTEEEAGRHRAELYLKNVEAQYQRTRELRHDLKNHIDLLSLLLQEQKYEEMRDYLHIFGEHVENLALPVRSGNLVVDALLADKAARARREQIQVELSLCDLTGLSLRPDEICSLLGNLLDNAIEAAGRAGEGRFLSVEWVEGEKDFFLRVRNSLAEEENAVFRKGGELVSRKRDRRNQVGHGLGLRSVERTVHGCGGDLAVESRGGQFTVAVRLPREVLGNNL